MRRLALALALALVLVVVAGACTPAKPQREPERTVALASPAGSTEEPSRAEAPEDEVTEVHVRPPIPGMGMLEPPRLSVSSCEAGGISIVGDEVFLGHLGAVHRMGPHGTPVDSFLFELESKHSPAPLRSLLEVAGRWPDQLYVRADYGFREFDAVKLAHLKNGAWKFVNSRGRDLYYTGVWPWHDNSILAEAHEDGGSAARHRVVQGAGRPPSFRGVLRRAGCKANDGVASLADIHVSPLGPVTGVIACKSTWVARWEPGDREARPVRMSDGEQDWYKLALDDGGNGYILRAGEGAALFRWTDGTLTEQSLPEAGYATSLVTSPDGHPWMAVDGDFFRHDGKVWHRERLPGDLAISSLAGVSVGAPWALSADRGLFVLLADGAWNPVELPPVGSKGTSPVPRHVVVREPGDAWILAGYSKPGLDGEPVMGTAAVYTERPVESPYKCP